MRRFLNWKLLLVILVMGGAVSVVYYFRLETSEQPCQEVVPRIISLSEQTIDPDAVRVLSAEQIEPVLTSEYGFRCVGIAVISERRLSWVTWEQVTRDGTTYYGYDLHETEPLERSE